MSTAPGSLVRNSANRFTAVFVINGLQSTFSATMNPSVQPFSSNNVTLTYNKASDLTGTRSYNGRIGPDDLALTLDNGVQITGTLNQPGIDPAASVDGSGVWEQN
ncbi:hypothetical protein FPRO05_14313 [Fusarium proliferatum]|uniref:Uncharacterized protein n=1 Tax=Gibberella intermedia TaxID=948311 RepID=A0A365MR34_GIBIN|nr:hypothetical protein FPRO05_14313 [Fusarium proliferatum]